MAKKGAALPAPETPDYPPRPSDADVRKFALFLCETLEVFKRGWKIAEKATALDFDTVVATSISRCVLDDIWRYEVYHLGSNKETRPNAVKRAAYLVKWICRLRPLYVARGSTPKKFLAAFRPEEDTSLWANEAFAIFIACQVLAAELGRANIELTPGFYDRFLYDLHFRHFHEDSILELFDIVADRARGEDLISDQAAERAGDLGVVVHPNGVDRKRLEISL